MKTSFAVTADAFECWWESYMTGKSYNDQIFELLLVFENNDSRYYSQFMSSRRTKAHSAAFYAVVLAIKPFLPRGYYASNPQIKTLIKKYTGQDYKQYLAPLVKEIERSREDLLNEKDYH